MDINKSIEILNLSQNYTYTELKKAYHINALLYHPDKNKQDTTELFKNINTAYRLLHDNLSNTTTSNNIPDNSYIELLANFIDFILKNDNQELLSKINKQSEQIIKNILDKLSIDIVEDVYLYIENNSVLFQYIHNNTKELIINILKQYIQDYTVIRLKPTIHNLINRDVCRLKVNDEIIYIPLWHNKLIYQKNIIDIQPDLSDNITIIDNVIYYRLEKKYDDIIELIKQNNQYIYIYCIDKYINIENILFKSHQTIILKNKGLPKIDYNNNFSLNNYNDIYINLHLFY